MRDFSFYKQEDNDSREIESIIRQRRRKIARQQLIYTIILIIIISVICIWIYRKTVYAEFDGYVSLDMTTFRTGEDVYFLKANVRVGDLVVPGDTLFSYAIAQNFFDHTHNDYEPAIISRNRDLRVQYGLVRQDLDVLRVRISELERQLSTEDHNIKFGLSDNHNKLRTEQELAEAREQYNALKRKLGVLWGAVAQSSKSMARLNNNGHGYLRIAHMYNFELLKELGLVYYATAVDSSIVARKYVSANTLVLRGESIMEMQSLKLRNNNLVIVAYVMPDEMKYVNYHSHAEIIVNDEVSFTGTVMMLGARTEEIPGELRSTLSRDHTASIVVFDIDPDQDIPFWAMTNGVPVRIRINKFKDRTPVEGDYIIYNTSSGVYQNTLKHSKHQCLLHPDTTSKEEEHHIYEVESVKLKSIEGDGAVKTIPSTGATKPVRKPDITSEPMSGTKTPGPEITGNAKGPYHIIIASGEDESGARRQAGGLRRLGYSHARVITTGGLHRVCISSFPDKKSAERALRHLKTHAEFGEAWIIYRKEEKK